MTASLKELRKENKREMEAMEAEDRRILYQIREYFEMPRMGAVDSELLVRDLIGMTQEARMRGESLQEVIGSDRRGWCESIKEGYGRFSTKERVLSALRNGCGRFCLFWVFMIGWGNDFKDMVAWVEILLLAVCLGWDIADEFLGIKRRNFAFYTEKEKKRADAREGVAGLAVLIASGVLAMAAEPLRRPALHFTGASTILWLAVFLVFLICAVLYRNLIKSQLAGKN